MKPVNQFKVIALSMFAVVVMIGVIVAVSFKTTEFVASHAAEHGSDHGSESHAAAGHDEHKADEHKAEEHKAEEHKAEEHKAEEHKAEEHKAEEHKAEEHKAEEHKADEHKADEHAADGHADVKTVAGNPENGGAVFMKATCQACHKISTLDGAVGALGPALDGIGARAASRVDGLSAEAYIRQSIEQPDAYKVDGYAVPMTAGLNKNLTETEYNDLVAYLLALK